MSSLMPFRPWIFADGDLSRISSLTNPERKSDDRSPFVRYARSAVLWAEWVRDGIVIQSEEPVTPTVEIEGMEFRFGILPIESLRTTMSLPPSAKEHWQRLIEGVQLYPDPIVAVEDRKGQLHVVGGHELFEAARAYQHEMARPGRSRSSDHCLVALAPHEYLAHIQTQSRAFETNKSEDEVIGDLRRAGFDDSPRADDPSNFKVTIGSTTLSKVIDHGSIWQTALADAIGIKSLDLGSKKAFELTEPIGKKIVLTSPRVSLDVLEMTMEYSFGSFTADLLPPSGAMMWSLRDF